MEIEKSKNKLVIKSPYFSVSQNLYSGQVFRFKKYGNGYILAAGKELAYMEENGVKTEIFCTDSDYFYNYFDLDTDYSLIIKRLSDDLIIKKAADFGRGIRILRQEKLETLISFIISANNNIKRIQGIIERICVNLGEKLSFEGIEYYAFPSAKSLAKAGEAFYKGIGAGYRAPYIDRTAAEIAAGFDLDAISDMTRETASKTLMSLYGIGKKVCDCILLFAYGRQDVFPVDTWIEKVYRDSFCPCGENIPNREKISEFFTDRFKGLSGYTQQYLFYYKRNTPGEENI